MSEEKEDKPNKTVSTLLVIMEEFLGEKQDLVVREILKLELFRKLTGQTVNLEKLIPNVIARTLNLNDKDFKEAVTHYTDIYNQILLSNKYKELLTQLPVREDGYTSIDFKENLDGHLLIVVTNINPTKETTPTK